MGTGNRNSRKKYYDEFKQKEVQSLCLFCNNSIYIKDLQYCNSFCNNADLYGTRTALMLWTTNNDLHEYNN